MATVETRNIRKSFGSVQAVNGVDLSTKEGEFLVLVQGRGEAVGPIHPAQGQAAALGVACPVVGNRCALTNLDWVVDGEGLKKAFGIKRLVLVNDLAAIGWGVGLLGDSDIHILQEGSPLPGNAALLAAGTGLGEAMLFWDGGAHTPSASEGGHTDFAPRNAAEVELLNFLIAKYGHVSYERIVSGPGLENIYEFVKASGGRPEPEYLGKRFASEGVAPAVSDEAINGTDENCRTAIDIFVTIYGAEAGNLALKTLSTAGVYVGGGIAPKILKAMEAGEFLFAFRDKGRYRELMSKIPVKVILNDRAGLIGAANLAATLVDGQRARRIIMTGGLG